RASVVTTPEKPRQRQNQCMVVTPAAPMPGTVTGFDATISPFSRYTSGLGPRPARPRSAYSYLSRTQARYSPDLYANDAASQREVDVELQQQLDPLSLGVTVAVLPTPDCLS
ncbi:hypothetical protein FOZ62_014008, partial [Perkinsus olseni]